MGYIKERRRIERLSKIEHRRRIKDIEDDLKEMAREYKDVKRNRRMKAYKEK